MVHLDIRFPRTTGAMTGLANVTGFYMGRIFTRLYATIMATAATAYHLGMIRIVCCPSRARDVTCLTSITGSNMGSGLAPS